VSTRYWYDFWVLNFVVAGSAFLVIALIVFVRGIGDLRQMFTRLRARGAARSAERGAKSG
jgi:hypothetical protein